MRIRHITVKMLEKAAKEFDDWYGVKIPITIMAKYAEEASYDDIQYFDTVSREKLASFVAYKVTGHDWPIGATSKKVSDKFFNDFKKKCGRFHITVTWNDE